jgi:DNA-binding LacI/PurR family transcriptional regulator
MRALVDLSDPPTAVLATTDVLAIGGLHAAYEAGWVVPRDLSVIGFDDIPMAAFAIPALTTIRMPVTDMAIRAVDLAVDQAEGGFADGSAPHVLAPTLIVRQSVATPRSGPRPEPIR